MEYLKAMRPLLPHPLPLGVSGGPWLKSRGLEPRGSSSTRGGGEEVSGTRAGTQPRSCCPTIQGREEHKGAEEEMTGAGGVGEEAGGVGSRTLGVLGQGAPPCCFPTTSCFRPESAHIPVSGAQPPWQACSLLPCSVCFLSHFAKCLLIFSTKRQCLPRAAVITAGNTPAAGCYKEPYNKQKRL